MSEYLNRLDPLLYLATTADLEIDYEALMRSETEAKFVHDTFSVLPTIGCEVEVKWSALFPDAAEHYFGEQDSLGRFTRTYADLSEEDQVAIDALKAEQDSTYLPRYEATCHAGIPAGSDAYWEFANAPSYSARVLATEVELLIETGLIPEGKSHSLHITLGGLAVGAGGASMILSGLELMHGSPERILLATEGSRLGTATAWARRGQDGLRQRSSIQLSLGENVGTELRTLSIESAEDAHVSLGDAQILAAVLMAYRQNKVQGAAPTKVLGELWPTFTSRMKELWKQQKLPNHTWGKPHTNPEPWLRWADIITDARDYRSDAHEVTEVIEDIITNAEVYLGALLTEVPSMSGDIVNS